MKKKDNNNSVNNKLLNKEVKNEITKNTNTKRKRRGSYTERILMMHIKKVSKKLASDDVSSIRDVLNCILGTKLYRNLIKNISISK